MRWSKAYLTLLLLLAPKVFAEDLRGFWQPGIASDFSVAPVANSSSKVKFKEVAGISEKSKVPATESNQEEFTTENSAQPKPIPQSKEEVLARYGNPRDAGPFMPKTDAPPTLQGMAAALQLGDKELAFEYARAHVKQLYGMQDFLGKATEYQMLAMEAEGLRPTPDEKDPNAFMSNERLELKDIIERAKLERQKELQEQSFDAKAEELLNEDDVSTASRGVTVKENLENLPIDPQGAVQVLFFFNPNSEETTKALKEVIKTQQALKADPKVKITGLTSEPMSLIQLEIVRQSLNLEFPLKNGGSIMQQLKVTSAPTIVFVTDTTKKTFRLGGQQKSEDLVKIIKLMQGGN